MKKIKSSVLFAAIGLLGLSSVSSVRAGLVGHWVADDWTGGSNNWLDRVASKVATANGSATIVSGAFSGGTATKGIVFDGVDDFFEVSSANSPVGGKNAMTVVALFKATQGATGSDGAFWQYPGPVNSEGPGTPNDFGITYNAAGEANGFFNQAVSLSSTVSVIDGSPHTMILTWRSVEGGGDEIARLYVDGVLVGSTSATDGASGQVHTSAIRFGRDIENARWFRGTVGEIRFYDSIENAATLHSALVTPVPEIDVKGRNTSIASGDTTPSAADGTDFGTVMTGGSSVTSTFVVTNAGNAALNFTGNPKVDISGTGAAHFSLLTGAFSGLTVDNASFETPVQSSGGFTYGPTGTGGWVFGGEAGIARNSSPWYINPAPDGNQAAYIQSNGSGAYFYQNINFPAVGTYVISFDIVRRSASYEGNDIDVRMDGVSIGSVSNTQQTTDTWATFTFTYNCPSAGNHELRFVGTRANDRDSAIDRVRVDHSTVFLAANGSTSFQVKYAPSAAGTHAATVTIQNDDSDEGTYTFALQGTAVASGTSQTWNADTGNGNGSANTTADGLRIRRNGGNIEFSADSGTTWSASTVYSTTTVLTLTGSGADDTFVIDFSGGNPIPSGGVAVAGGGQVSSDKLVLIGGTFGTVTHNLSNTTDGNVVIASMGTITYTGLEPVDMTGSTITDLVFNLPAGGSNAILTDDGTTANGISRLTSSPTAFELTDFSNPSGSVTINRGNAADTLTINATPDFTATLTVGGVGAEFSTVTVAGALTLAADKNFTVHSSATVNFSTSGSDVALSGTGAASITTARDIVLASGASLTTVNGDLTLSANAAGGAGNFIGVDVNGGLIQATGTGVVSVTGKGGSGGGSVAGVNVRNGGDIIGGTAGTLTVTGTSGTTGTDQIGVYVTDSGTTIDSGGANVSVSGTGAASTTFNSLGVGVYNSAVVRAGSGGTVTVVGVGGATTSGAASYSLGITVESGGTITSVNGNVSVTGTGGAATGTFNHGVSLQSGGIITAGNAANTVTVNGTGGAGAGTGSSGVVLNSSGANSISSAGGALTITGTAGTSGSGFEMLGGSTSVSTPAAGGDLTIIADTMLISAGAITVNNAANSATLRQLTNGKAINLGGADSGTQLGLTDAELDRVTAATINLGNTSAGSITIQGAITRASATHITATVANDRAIIFDSTGSLNANGGDVTLTTGGTGGIISPGTATTDITCAALTLTAGTGGIGSIIAGPQTLLINATSLTTSTPSVEQYITEANTVTLVSLNAGSSSISLYNGTYSLSTDAVNDSTEIWLSGTLDVNGATDTFAKLIVGSTAAVTGTGVITADIANPVVGTGGSVTTGAGTLSLGNSASTTGYALTGPITVASGHTLILRDANSSSMGNTVLNGTLRATNGVSVGSSRTLSGTGTLYAIMQVPVNATVAPGNSAPGILNVSNVNFSTSSTFTVEINGTTAGTGYDQLNVTGTVVLGGGGGATLSLSGTLTPVAGQTFIIINNDGSDAISGTFNGLAEGAIISNFLGSGLSAKISYVGGTGNDVTLTTPAPVTWTAATAGNGASNGTADNFWIRRNGANIEFSADNGSTWPVSVSYVMTSALTLSGSNDDDSFGIDYSGGNPVPYAGVTITGGGQVTTGDSITLKNGSHTTVTYGFVNNSDGSIDVDGNLISYTGLEPITDNNDAVNRVFDFTGGAETITVTSVSATQTKVDSTLGESVTFNNPTTSMTLNAGTGNDTVLFYSLSSGWTATTTTINGGAGDDIIQLNKSVATTAAITVNGDAHTTGDVLHFDREGDATISASGASPGTITGGSTAIQTVSYNTIETINVHLYGSIGDAVVADRGPYFSTGTILLRKAATGGQQVVNTTIKDPYEITLDAAGNFVVADYEVNAGTAGIYKIDRFTGTKTTMATNGFFEVPFGVKADNSGGVNNGKYIVADLDADNDNANKWGAIFVVDPGTAPPSNQTKLSSRLAGTGTDFYWLTGLAIGSAGDIYVCDQGDQSNPGAQPPRIFHVDPATGNRTVMAEAGTLRQPAGLAVISGTGTTAQLVVVDAGLKKLFRFTGSGSVLTPSATDELTHTGVTFDKPTHIALDRDGNYVITDAPVGAVAGQRRVHRMNSTTLSVTTIASDGFLEQPRGTVAIP